LRLSHSHPYRHVLILSVLWPAAVPVCWSLARLERSPASSSAAFGAVRFGAPWAVRALVGWMTHSDGIVASKPFSPRTTLRVSSIEHFVPPRMLRVVGVGQTFGDDALKVGIDHDSVKRARFADQGRW
jgi:hypothetical protein